MMVEENSMMHHHVAIQARFRPEMLERILRVVRHRGFQVCTMHVLPIINTDEINIALTVASQRSIDLLSAQLAKLIDVTNVDIQRSISQLPTSQQLRA